MPTYDYQCDQCSHVFELFHGINETPRLSCPKCQTKKVYRKISGGAGIHFKGSGFYVNDYKKKKDDTPNKKADGSDKKGSDKKPEKGQRGSESTPAAKKETKAASA